MEGFLTFIIVFIAVVWILRKVFPRLLLWYLQRKMKQGGGVNSGTFGGNGFGGFWSNGAGFNGTGFNGTKQQDSAEEQVRESKKQEGKVIVESKPEKEKVIDKTFGEYVDYEEE